MSPKIMYQTRFEMIKFHEPKNESFDLVQVSKLITTRMREKNVCVNVFLYNFVIVAKSLMRSKVMSNIIVSTIIFHESFVG
jgi:hypothetical protein